MATFRDHSSFVGRRYDPVTPDDDADLPWLTRMVIIAEGGTLVVHDETGASKTLTLPAGGHTLTVQRVLEASTATGITAVY